ncbi:MIP/aquaporin family protein [uncultured Agitococcus sp.]|uniref:aquaporin n=1 Tax=uncultured Agitococcus sp. TaxID=1506599 RepID=UPI002611A4E0|nr:MIP/aquaporin family protein [uncultured Agitococcus sp.]
MTQARILVAEGLGTALLLAIVVGSGIMAEQLAQGNIAVALLANALATGAGLVVLIWCFGGISGAHFNPAVTWVCYWQQQLNAKQALSYSIVQLIGAVLGVWLAHAMFNQPILMLSNHERTGFGQYVSEFVATFGLIMVIIATSRQQPKITPMAVALYIVSAYWFTASTSFANPAVTVARTLTDTFAGIRPVDAPLFICSQLIAAKSSQVFSDWLWPKHNA